MSIVNLPVVDRSIGFVVNFQCTVFDRHANLSANNWISTDADASVREIVADFVIGILRFDFFADLGSRASSRETCWASGGAICSVFGAAAFQFNIKPTEPGIVTISDMLIGKDIVSFIFNKDSIFVDFLDLRMRHQDQANVFIGDTHNIEINRKGHSGLSLPVTGKVQELARIGSTRGPSRKRV